MREVVAATFLSLDGVMQAPGGPEEDRSGGFALGGWSVNYWDEMMGKSMDAAFDKPFDLLLGRKTYDIFASYWPFQEADNPITVKFDAATKYVATKSKAPLKWQNSVKLEGDAAEAVAELKKGEGPALLLQGSGDFIQTLLAADLIDRFDLMIFPLLIGKGKRLFADGTVPGALKLVSNQTSTTA